jgi:signal peptidase I
MWWVRMSENAPKSANKQQSFVENLKVLAIAVVIALLVRTFVAEPRFIPSGSMEPTMLINDRFVAEKVSYRFRDPKAGEIVIFSAPEALQKMAGYGSSEVLIKRVMGLPGDRISIRDGQVSVNGQILTETYTKERPKYDCPNAASPNATEFCRYVGSLNPDNFTVPDGTYFVMGDNRNNSADSHVWGFLPRQNIIGRAWWRFFPIDRFGSLL